MAALTKAVYDSAINDDDEPPEPSAMRLLPGSTTVAAVLIVLVLLAGIGVWRHARATDRALEADQAAEQSAELHAEKAAETGAGGTGATPAGPATPGTDSTGEVVVHVSGAVAAPGVLTLPASSRVIDAITAAGGALEDADLDAINLARPVVDGEHIRVAALGQSPPEPSGGAESAQPACVRLDTASATDLQTLPGIGPALAQRIIDYRATHPHILSVDALDEVPGIGHALIEKIRPGVCP